MVRPVGQVCSKASSPSWNQRPSTACAVCSVRHHDLDIVHLADTVQTADTLLQQIRVERQIEHHQLTGELEVAAFGADPEHSSTCAPSSSEAK